jgi:tetratricopeptide (TPR) repeat protein
LLYGRAEGAFRAGILVAIDFPWGARAEAEIARADRARDSRDWPQAARHYARALKRKPELAHIWVQLGHARKEVGQLREAGACYLAALQIEGNSADTYLQLGHLLKITGRPEQARSAYARALELDAQCPDAADELARLA